MRNETYSGEHEKRTVDALMEEAKTGGKTIYCYDGNTLGALSVDRRAKVGERSQLATASGAAPWLKA
jgi:hypothetical protein